jgi:hypothetical protein
MSFYITLTGTIDGQEDCILAIELIQDIKPGAGEKLSDISPWNAVVRSGGGCQCELYCTSKWKRV